MSFNLGGDHRQASFALRATSRRTILLVDRDPGFRANLRLVLEGEGFLVGEAANAKEGERTLQRIRPDAILAELMLETIDPHGGVATRLRETGSKIPLYLVSGAYDAMSSVLDINTLGIAGIFAKPVDPKILLQTLKPRLRIR